MRVFLNVWQRSFLFLTLLFLSGCAMQSVPDCTVAGWWSHEDYDGDLDGTVPGRDDDGRNACIKYGRCTSKGGSTSSRGSSSGSKR